MAAELEVIKSPDELTRQVMEIAAAERPATLLAELGGGVLRFSEAVFPNVTTDKVLAQLNERESEGRGPHFDVYPGFTDDRFPWIGVYNLSGRAVLSVMDLPEDLAAGYFARYPKPTDEAFEARRLFSAIALGQPGAEPAKGKVKDGTGFVLPQRAQGPHIIHEIVPEDDQDPGRFVKLVVPSKSSAVRRRMKESGYQPLDELLTMGLGKVVVGNSATVPASTPRTPRRVPSVPRPSRRQPSHRSCNLD